MLRKLALVVPLMVVSLAFGAPAPEPALAQTNECLGVDAMNAALLDGRARRLAEIRRLLEGDIVKADLCMDAGKLAYRVTLLTRDGVVKRVVLDASSGQFMTEQKK